MTNRRAVKIAVICIACGVVTTIVALWASGYWHRRYLYTRLMRIGETSDMKETAILYNRVYFEATDEDFAWIVKLFGKVNLRVDLAIIDLIRDKSLSRYIPWMLTLLDHEESDIRITASDHLLCFAEDARSGSVDLSDDEVRYIEKAAVRLIFDKHKDVRFCLLAQLCFYVRDRAVLASAYLLADESPEVREEAKAEVLCFLKKHRIKGRSKAEETNPREVAGKFLSWWKVIKPKLPKQLLPEGLTEEMVLSRLAEFAASPDPPPED